MTRFNFVRGVFVLAAAVAGAVAACGGDNNDTGDASTCAAPLLQCGAACTDPQSDPNNCGACGTKCDTANAEVCSQGKCALSCGGGTSKCGSSCFDLQNDQKNCGACGTACAQGETCSAGKCAIACSQGLTQCGEAGACVDTQTDSLNCGACGSACTANTTCQAGACVANLLTTAPALVSGTLTGCTTQYSSEGRKTALDDANHLYVAMICGGTVYVASSTNGGISFSAPVTTGITNASEVAITASWGAKPVLYVAGVSQTSASTVFTSSADIGKTFSAPITLDSTSWGSGFGISMDIYKDTVYVETNPSSGSPILHVLRNGAGAGDAGLVNPSDAGWELQSVDAGTGIFPTEIVVDQSNGNVWAIGEIGSYHLVESTNGGATWSAPFVPPGSSSFTDWVLAKGTIFQVGTSDALTIIPTSAPTTATTIGGFGAAGGAIRSLGVDVGGNVYVATPVGSTVKIDRVLFSGATSDGGVDGGAVISSTRNITAVGTTSYPSITSRALNTALVAWTVSGAVYASVQTY